MSNHNYKLICKNTISESTIRQKVGAFVAGVGRFGKRVGTAVYSETERQVRDARRRMHEEELRHLERTENQILIPHYSRHLGISEAKIRTILDTPETAPILPFEKTEKGKKRVLGADLREYQAKLADFHIRRKLVDQIEGLAKSIPEIGHLRRSFKSQRETALQKINKADPITMVDGVPVRRTEILRRELDQKILTQKRERLQRKQKKSP